MSYDNLSMNQVALGVHGHQKFGDRGFESSAVSFILLLTRGVVESLMLVGSNLPSNFPRLNKTKAIFKYWGLKNNHQLLSSSWLSSSNDKTRASLTIVTLRLLKLDK